MQSFFAGERRSLISAVDGTVTETSTALIQYIRFIILWILTVSIIIYTSVSADSTRLSPRLPLIAFVSLYTFTSIQSLPRWPHK
jgi:hypothetical protein